MLDEICGYVAISLLSLLAQVYIWGFFPLINKKVSPRQLSLAQYERIAQTAHEGKAPEGITQTAQVLDKVLISDIFLISDKVLISENELISLYIFQRYSQSKGIY